MPHLIDAHAPGCYNSANARSEREDELAGFWRIKLEDSRIIDNVYDDVFPVETIRVTKRTPKTHTGLA